MHFQQKTLPQKPTKQATMRTRRHAQPTHTSQCNAFTTYLPSLHLSNHTHHKPYHTPIRNTLQHTSPSTIIIILNRDTTTTTLASTSTMITYFTKHNTPRKYILSMVIVQLLTKASWEPEKKVLSFVDRLHSRSLLKFQCHRRASKALESVKNRAIEVFHTSSPVFSPGLAVRRAHFSGSAAVKCARSTETFLPCFFFTFRKCFRCFSALQKNSCLGQYLFPAEDSDSYMQTVQVAAKTPKGIYILVLGQPQRAY